MSDLNGTTPLHLVSLLSESEQVILGRFLSSVLHSKVAEGSLSY